MSVKHDILADDLARQGFRVLHAGDDYDYTFTVTRDGSPLDLTGAKLWLSVKGSRVESDAEAKLQLTEADGISITNAAGGVFVVQFRGEGAKTTANLAGKWPYDMQAKLSGAAPNLITLARGTIEFLPNITRSVS
jgi:hypothetical protein